MTTGPDSLVDPASAIGAPETGSSESAGRRAEAGEERVAKDRPQAIATLRRFVPWQGPATRTDLTLIGAVLAVVALGLVLRPLKPFLLASHPVVLAFLTGDLTAIGAAAAFARIGEAPLWLVVVAGAAGMVKLDWLTWWAGRQWGGGIVRMFTTSERALRFAARATELNPWLIRAAVVLALLPGVPTAVVYAMAGWAGMRLATFLLLDLAGALVMTGVVAGLGYGLGQRAVDLVLVVDRYASVVSLTMIGVAALIPLAKRLRESARARSRRRNATSPAQRVALPSQPDQPVMPERTVQSDALRWSPTGRNPPEDAAHTFSLRGC